MILTFLQSRRSRVLNLRVLKRSGSDETYTETHRESNISHNPGLKKREFVFVSILEYVVLLKGESEWS